MKRLLVPLIVSLCFATLRVFASGKDDQARDQRQAAPKLFAEIAEAPEVELLTIDPNNRLTPKQAAEENPKKSRIDGFLVKSRATTRDRAQIKSLALSLRRGIEQSDGEPALCFDPKHVLRVPRPSGDMIIVVGFSCSQGYILGFSGMDMFTTTNAPEAEWQRIFSANGL